MIVNAEHHEHVRCQAHRVVVHPVIDQEVTGHINVIPVSIVLAQRENGFGERIKLGVGFCHRVPIRIGVVDIGVVLGQRAVQALLDEPVH